MALAAIWPMYRRALREALRVPLATFVVPVVVGLFMLTIFARVFENIVSLDAFGELTYAEYITPGTMVMAVMLGSSTAGVSTAVELTTGFFDRMRISPLRELPSLRARRLADATRIACYELVLLVAAWVAGVHIENWGLAVLFGCGFTALWCFAYGGLALAACMRTGSAETAQGMAPLFFPILFLSTAVMPASLLPDWLASIAEWNPVSYLADAMRAANAGAVDWTATWRAVVGVLVVASLTQLLVVRARRSIERQQ